ncbi:MAG TPA: hypothetical protein VOB72_16680 [Candidatus Dormibacteraeota bacterium]|nr:hypothetical protein [Candidatus Dormibacteraeota bacterium]
MRERFEEEPDLDDDGDDLDDGRPDISPHRAIVPPPDGSREYEYRTELLTAAQVTDGTTLATQLTKASSDGWDLVDIINAGDRHAILLRRLKKPERNARQVGFAPPKL